MADTDELMPPGDVAEMLHIDKGTLIRWLETTGHGPPVIDLTPPGVRKRTLRWRRGQVIEWLAELERKGVTA
jgi:hypothetical protein